MNRRVTRAALCIVLFCCAAVLAAEDGRSPGKEIVKTGITTVRIEPVRDSLRATLLDRADGENNRLSIDCLKNIARTLQLHDSTARDSACLSIDRVILEFFLSRGKYRVAVASDDSATQDSIGVVRSSLQVVDTVIIKDADQYGLCQVAPAVLRIKAYAITLDAQIVNGRGQLIWSNQTVISYNDEGRSLTDIFSKKTIKKTIKNTFKELF